MDPDVVVRNAPELSRYELVVDGSVIGFADYRIDGREVVFPHTEIDVSRRGQGWGEVLVRGALDDVRTTGRTVVPRCWYVMEFLEAHAEYADLRAA
jgi:predicted GNAT family acetyltransferase